MEDVNKTVLTLLVATTVHVSMGTTSTVTIMHVLMLTSVH